MRTWPTLVLLSVAGCAQLLGIDDPTLAGVPDAPMPDAVPQVTVTVELEGDGGGRVTTFPAGISCPGTCSATFSLGSELTLSASRDSGSTFSGFTAAGCTGTAPCVLTLAGDLAVKAEFTSNSRGHNFVFITSRSVSVGDLNPITRGDAFCNESAQAVRLPGRYVAWLSTTTVAARDRLGNARGWVRVDGLPFSDQVTDITAGKIYYPITIDEAGDPVINAGVITGTRADGTAAPAMTCGDYTTTSGMMLVGLAGGTTLAWTEWVTPSCQQSAPIYCFGIDEDRPVPQPAASGRLAFASLPAFSAATGLAGADEICRSEAAAARLTGTFKALLSTSTASAASRFSAAGMPWVRRDGVSIAPTAAALLAGQPQTTITVSAAGSYENGPVASGSLSPDMAGTRSSTCGDWSSDSPDEHPRSAAIHHLTQWFGHFDFLACAHTYRVYCLQD